MATRVPDASLGAAALSGWRARARCAATDLTAFFPRRGESGREAKAICAGCPVQRPCLEYALRRNERHGVWGGLGETERRRLRPVALGQCAAPRDDQPDEDGTCDDDRS